MSEPLEILELQPFGAELLLVCLLRLLERVLAVEELEQEVFVVLEPIVAQRYGILDDEERPAPR